MTVCEPDARPDITAMPVVQILVWFSMKGYRSADRTRPTRQNAAFNPRSTSCQTSA